MLNGVVSLEQKRAEGGGSEKGKQQRQRTLTGGKCEDNALGKFLQTSEATLGNFSASRSPVLRAQVNVAVSAHHHPTRATISKAQQARVMTSSKATGGQEYSRHTHSLPITTAAALYL